MPHAKLYSKNKLIIFSGLMKPVCKKLLKARCQIGFLAYLKNGDFHEFFSHKKKAARVRNNTIKT
jgi:hypothetical protein